MLNYIWLGLILISVVVGGIRDLMPEVTSAAFDSARMAVMDLALPLVGIMALWLGMMRLAEKSGFIVILARALRPIMRFLFPDVPSNHPAMGGMIMNISANMLGLGNAATPFGLKAMKDLETLSPNPGVATNAMCTFLVINTSSVTLISSSAVGLMAAGGAERPTAFIGTALIATFCSTAAGLIAVKFLEKLPAYRMPTPVLQPATIAAKTGKSSFATESDFDESDEDDSTNTEEPDEQLKPISLWGKIAIGLFLAFFVYLFAAQLFPDLNFFERTEHGGTAQASGFFIRVIDAVGILAIPFIISFFALFAALRGIRIYEEFVVGAKEGFEIAIRIIPYLVAILVAIGMFRAADGLDLLASILGPILSFLHFPVELLPLSLMRPLSGSGSFALLGDLIATYGPDSFLARAGATISGSTETTFYVLAVYFGSVGIRRTRHALPAGLFADAVGIIAAVTVATIVFG
ncbi:MAG TPA: nucleoside recognition domain-containing protein [Opitutales bacterium]|nr:nucleoside recognition domain-containing protein [Opitutales bacterium]